MTGSRFASSRGAAAAWYAAVLALGAGGAPTGQAADPVGQGPALVPADTTITIRTTGSGLEFVPARIAVRQGTRVRLVYVNAGTLPHNLVLVRDGNDIDLLGMAALDAGTTGYVPLQHRDRMLGYTPLAGPGDTVEVVFEAPPPGEYPYVCLYTGHYNMMLGTLRSLR